MLELLDADIASLIGAAGVRGRAVAAPAAGHATRRDAGIAIVADRSAFDALAADWRALDAEAAGPGLFQSFHFCRTVYDHHLRAGSFFEPRVLTLRERGKLVGLLPLQRKAAGVARVATGFAEPYQQYTDVRLAPDAPADAAARLLSAATRLPGVDGLEFLKVRDDSVLAPLLTAREAVRSNEDAAPFVDLTPYADFKAYHATVNAKTRKNMRNTRNRLAKVGALEHHVLTDPADVAALVRRAQEGRERWLEEMGLTSRAFRDPTFGAFMHAIASPTAGMDVMAMSLTLDGTPIADQWGFVFNRRYYAFVATWAPGYDEFSPGKLHLEEVIRACHARGLDVADFLIPAARYKFTWTDQAMGAADYALPLSLTARLQFIAWSGTLRPLLKKAALSLPTHLRARIARLVRR